MSTRNELPTETTWSRSTVVDAVVDVVSALIVVAGGLGLGTLSLQAGHGVAWAAGLVVGATWGGLLLLAMRNGELTSSVVLRRGALTVLLVGTGLVLIGGIWTAVVEQPATG